jgi:hypothetical protein
MSRELDQIDLFAGSPDTTVSTQSTVNPAPTGAGAVNLKSVTEIKPTACQPRTIYSVERLPNGYTRITQHGRVTFNGLIGRVSA